MKNKLFIIGVLLVILVMFTACADQKKMKKQNRVLTQNVTNWSLPSVLNRKKGSIRQLVGVYTVPLCFKAHY